MNSPIPPKNRPIFVKLQSGNWGVRTPGVHEEGTVIEVYTRTNWTARKIKLLNRVGGPFEDGSCIYAITPNRVFDMPWRHREEKSVTEETEQVNSTLQELAGIVEEIRVWKEKAWKAINSERWEELAGASAKVVSLQKKEIKVRARWLKLTGERAKKK